MIQPSDCPKTPEYPETLHVNNRTPSFLLSHAYTRQRCVRACHGNDTSLNIPTSNLCRYSLCAISEIRHFIRRMYNTDIGREIQASTSYHLILDRIPASERAHTLNLAADKFHATKYTCCDKCRQARIVPSPYVEVVGDRGHAKPPTRNNELSRATRIDFATFAAAVLLDLRDVRSLLWCVETLRFDSRDQYPLRPISRIIGSCDEDFDIEPHGRPLALVRRLRSFMSYSPPLEP